tara:strand:- start:7073 stop:8731 length:1659 start_codon:yes stop_codon:yes gene_type:complete
MDEFGSPISGGITAVRRNVSSNFFGAPQRPQAQADPVTTNLLQQQSLSITNVSRQLESITSTLVNLNFSLNSIRENLAVSETIERQREAAKQKRERILAEQGLREGKESALEAKIQNALVSPVRRVAQKAQFTLSRLFDAFLFLAGGWLTVTGFDLIQAIIEGNGQKIRRIGTIFAGGLVLIGGTITAINIGLKTTLGLLGNFAGTVAKFAFGNILKPALSGIRRLLSTVVRAVGEGILGRTITNIFTKKGLQQAAGNIGKQIIGFLGLEAISRKVFKKRGIVGGLVNLFRPKNFVQATRGKNILPSGLKQVSPAGEFFRKLNPFKKVGTEVVEEGGKKLIQESGKKIVKEGTKKGFLSIFKQGAKNLFRKLGGPFVTFIFNLISGEGIGAALAAAAGFAAGAKVGAAIGAAIGAFFGGIGAGPGALIGGFIGGIIGEEAIKRLYKGIVGMFTKPDAEFEAINENTGETISDGSNINPVSNNSELKAENISDTENLEGQPAVINVDASTLNQNNNGGASASNSSGDSQTVPNIPFDQNNLHTLFATSTTGVS